MSEIKTSQLREEVNPVFTTARSCLQITAATGDEDSKKLLGILGFDDLHNAKVSRAVPAEQAKLVKQLVPAFFSQVEVRFAVTNEIIKALGVKNVLDLPCGYTPRGIKLAKSGIKYYGCDLPAVIDEIAPAVKKVIGGNENIRYTAVDATNYDSLKAALGDAEGELFITTEGMLMYFTQNELEEVFTNIRRLLTEYGGRWVTCDSTLMNLQKEIIGAVMGVSPDDGKAFASIGRMAAVAMSDTEQAANLFFDKDIEKVKKFISDMGFEMSVISAGDHLPETMYSLAPLPEDRQKAAREVISKMDFWVLTPKSDAAEVDIREQKEFRAVMKREGSRLAFELSGRLDTITATDLLALYRKAEGEGNISSVRVDCSELQYVSSAGLRVLMIMHKSGGGVTLTNVSDGVSEILETTGILGILKTE